MFRSDLWSDTPPKGEMFIWVSPNETGGWSCGLGYWTVTEGQWANLNGPRWRDKSKLKYHPMPDPTQTGPVYVVWSHEHSAWWATGGWGYTTVLDDAGKFSRAAAIKVCHNAGAPFRIGFAPNEIAVRLEDALAAQELFV